MYDLVHMRKQHLEILLNCLKITDEHQLLLSFLGEHLVITEPSN